LKERMNMMGGIGCNLPKRGFPSCLAHDLGVGIPRVC
jgi:hypothetical protein